MGQFITVTARAGSSASVCIFDDAGWSPDSLHAIGVEPLPTPEPTAWR
jgi:hypothetical protein